MYNISMSFFSPKAELSLVFDIGSSSVGAGLVRIRRGETARMIHCVREFIPHQEKIDPDRLFLGMIEALKRAHQKIVTESASRLAGTGFRHVSVRRIFCSFASPWSVTRTKTLSVKRERPFTFTHQFLDSLMLEAEEDFKKGALSVIERRIIGTRLNGYDIKNPFGKRVREAEVSYFTGVVPKSVLYKTLEIFHSLSHSKYVKTCTFPLIAYSGLADVFPGQNDFICARIGGEISDVFIVEDGIIMESASFPGGQNPIVKNFAGKAGISPEEAASFLKLHAEGRAESGIAAKYEPIIFSLMREWVDDFRSVLEKLEGGLFLPQRVFLFMDGDLSHFFVKSLQEDATGNSRNLAVSFSVVLFSTDNLKQFLTWNDGISIDSLIAVISLFAERTCQSGEK